MDFASLMSAAKANTQLQREAATAKQVELKAQQKREAERERELKAKEEERRVKEAEAARRREAAQREVEAKLRLERERKRLEKAKLEEQAMSKPAKSPKPPPNSSSASTSKQPSLSTASSSLIRKKRKQRDAMFSDYDEGPSDSSAAARRRKTRPNSTPTSFKKLNTADTSTLSAKARLKAEFNPAEARQLNVNKRDTRSIEEIEADLRRKKELARGGTAQESVPQAGFFAGRKSATAGTSFASTANIKASVAKGLPQRTGSNAARTVTAGSDIAFGRVDQQNKSGTASQQAKPKRRSSLSPPPRSSASVNARRVPKGRASSYSPPLKAGSSLKQEIWSIINPNKTFGSHRAYDYDSDAVDDESDDMEAGYDEIEEENRQAERIARIEDKRELERLERRAKEKEAARKRKDTG